MQQNRNESAENRIVMRSVAGCAKVLEPLSKTPRDNLYPFRELTKRLVMRFAALCVCLETGKFKAVNIKNKALIER